MAAVAQGTAISVAMDMTGGIIARFRTMAISRASVLTGHVLGAMIQTMLAVAVVTGVALLIGWRPNATPVEWIAAIGVLAMVSWALTWLTVALGLVQRERRDRQQPPHAADPACRSWAAAFVPTDSMPTVLRWFAEYQPFTPFIETLRGLLMGTPIGNSAILAVAWCVVISLVGYLWARSLFNRDPAR